MPYSLRGLCLAALALLVLFSLPAAAQFNATVQGTVTDPSGAVISGANVTVTNQSNGTAKTTQTTGNGFYRVGGLPPGMYTVKIEAHGI